MRPEWLRAPVLFWCVVRGSNGPPLWRCDRSILTTARVPGDVGLYLMRAIVSFLSGLRAGFVIDRLTGDEAHVGLLPVLRATDVLAETAGLARLVDDLHTGNLHFKHQLDRFLDVGLGSVAAHAKRVLVVVLHRQRRLFGDVRGDEDIHQLLASHCKRSSIRFTAATVINTLSYEASASGFSAVTSRTSTYGRLREARYNFSSVASTMINTFSSDQDFSWFARRRVFAASS